MVTLGPSGGVATWREVVTGPRWAAFGKALKSRVWLDPRLEVVAFDEDRGWARTTTRFEVRGPQDAIDALKYDVMHGIKDYNHD